MLFTIGQVRHQIATALDPIYGEAETGQMVKMLFDHFCGISGAALALQKNDLLPGPLYDRMIAALQQLSAHTPVQYVLGHTWFYNLSFEVNPFVLIPRPETEELADLIVKAFGDVRQRDECKLLDIGTGSGCLAVTLKKTLPGWQVSACDISENSLQLARRNAALLEAPVDFFKGDILHWKQWPDMGPYHVIVSNPPYVCEREKLQMQANVLDHEPALALFVPDDDPLLFYRAIAEYAALRLVPRGELYLEINENYGPEIVDLLESFDYSDIELLKDFRGKDRFVIALNAEKIVLSTC